MNNTKLIIIILLISSFCSAQTKSEKKFETSFGLNIGSSISYVPERGSYAIGGLWGAQVDFVNLQKDLGFYVGTNYALHNIGRERGFDNGLNSDNIKIIEVPIGIIYRLGKQTPEKNAFSIKVGLSHALINSTNNVYIEDGDYNIVSFNMGFAFRFLLGNKLGLEPNLQFKYMNIPDFTVNETVACSISFIVSQVN